MQIKTISASIGALAVAMAATALLSGCDKGLGANGDKRAAADAADIEKAVRAEETQWNADYKTKDAAKISGHYTADASLMEPQAPPMNGADAIKAGITQFTADPNLDIQFSADRVTVAQAGDVAVTRGHYRLVTTNPATKAPQTETGSYVTVYRKQADGSWKAVEDIATPGPSAAPAKAG